MAARIFATTAAGAASGRDGGIATLCCWNFLFDRRLKDGPTVAEFWGAPQAHEEDSMTAARPERGVKAKAAA